MKWRNAQKDKLPQDKEEVLISVNGIYYISVYDADKRLFKVDGRIMFLVDEYMIYWTEFHNSPDADV